MAGSQVQSVGQVHLVLTERMKRKISERVKVKSIHLNDMKISHNYKPLRVIKILSINCITLCGISQFSHYFFFNIYLFIWLYQVLVAACRI